LLFRAALTFLGNYFLAVGWCAAATGAGMDASGGPAKIAVTELASLSAFASISEICHNWV
jgi:hypothetical protein